MKNDDAQADCFTGFNGLPEGYTLPERFTFPFYYEPHPLCVLAAKELQQALENESWDSDFGISYEKKGLVIGKMFGVLVVQNPEGKLGYLAAFSGKLTGKAHTIPFVPPVFDLATDGQFYLDGEAELNAMNRRVDHLENAPELATAQQHLLHETALAARELDDCKQRIKAGKAARKIRRTEARETLDEAAYAAFEETLRGESLNEHYFLKDLTRSWKERLQIAQQQVSACLDEVQQLKEDRKRKSAALQQRLFEHYTFLNSSGTQKSLLDLFRHAPYSQPPSGAGECAAPKLLQYAFRHGLQPLAIAEFWWGKSPVSEVRRHGSFYPACRGKCEPILGHMLAGMDIDPNPLLQQLAEEKNIRTVYEDEYLLVVNKPAEFLSVPGIEVEDSVYTRMKARYPEATGPLIVHRLDMSTSGLLVIAKTKEVHEHLQRQFLRRSVKKRYIALLDGLIAEDEGTIELPLRPDIDDRPRQLVCFDHGKPARTTWKVIGRRDGQTKLYFYPETGRTHQLRVHAAHALGLNAPILGDDLYGTKSHRLYLHAESITFRHPVSGEMVSVQLDEGF